MLTAIWRTFNAFGVIWYIQRDIYIESSAGIYSVCIAVVESAAGKSSLNLTKSFVWLHTHFTGGREWYRDGKGGCLCATNGCLLCVCVCVCCCIVRAIAPCDTMPSGSRLQFQFHSQKRITIHAIPILIPTLMPHLIPRIILDELKLKWIEFI